MKALKSIEYIILHCTAGTDRVTRDWDAIRRYHMNEKGWPDVGYHFCIERIGQQWFLLPGRSTRYMGAHCRASGRNHDSLGLAVVGQFDTAPPSTLLLTRTVKVLADMCLFFGVRADRVYGHREFEPGKTCPGSKWSMAATRDLLRQRLHETDSRRIVL